jgi:hypothetical protein
VLKPIAGLSPTPLLRQCAAPARLASSATANCARIITSISTSLPRRGGFSCTPAQTAPAPAAALLPLLLRKVERREKPLLGLLWTEPESKGFSRLRILRPYLDEGSACMRARALI